MEGVVGTRQGRGSLIWNILVGQQCFELLISIKPSGSSVFALFRATVWHFQLSLSLNTFGRAVKQSINEISKVLVSLSVY